MPTLSVLRAALRSARLPGLLHFACAAVLASGLLACAGTAAAVTLTNTATANFTTLADGPVTTSSNTTELITVLPPSPAVVTFYQYAPGTAAGGIAFDGGNYDSGGSFLPLATPLDPEGKPISLAGLVDVRATGIYRLGEPVFITLADANRNGDATMRDYIEVTVTTSTGDSERLRLQETASDSGMFAAVIPSSSGSVGDNDGVLTLATGSRITVDYQDPLWPDDTISSAALVDPFGFVFDAVSGTVINGASVTIVSASGAPATVYGDDGVSAFPSTVITGSSVTDASGRRYDLPPGGFRFPYVMPGSYRFVVLPPAGYTVPSAVPDASMPDDAGGNPYAVVTGSRGEVFSVLPGPALNIDIPADPTTAGLVLQKQVSRREASAGDFLQYRLSLQNISGATAGAPVVTDRLPVGMRYQSGSLRIDGLPAANPVIGKDGRTLTITLADIPAATTVQISYVLQLGSGVRPGNAVNTASATAAGGVMSSNTAQAAVRIVEPLMSGAFTLIGRVYEGDCNTPWEKLKGVANARLLMEDGTYVVTDKDGQYHFEGVRPGTHVVQLDVDSLPNGLEPVSCMDNTRFAGRSFSQFVDVQGGGLWRADFFTRARRTHVGIRFESRMDVQSVAPAADAAPVEIGMKREIKDYTLRAEFDSCRATLKAQGEADVQRLIEELSGEDIKRIELTGNSDNQRLSPRCQLQFKDNYALSEARARTVGEALAAGLYLKPEQIMVSGRGSDAPVAGNDTADGKARNRRTEVRVYLNEGEALGRGEKASASAARVSRVTGMSHRIELDGSSAVDKLKVTAMLPAGAAYRRGSARIDGQPVDDPVLGDGIVIFPLQRADAGWSRVVEFDSYPLPPLAEAVADMRRYTLRPRFDSCSSSLHRDGEATLAALVGKLRKLGKIERVELVGHSDDQSLSPRCQARYRDNQALSLARARATATLLARELGLREEQIYVEGRGAAEPVADNATAAGRASNRRLEVSVRLADDLAAITRGRPVPVDCPQSSFAFKAMASFEAPGSKRSQTAPVETRLACPVTATENAAASADGPEASSPRQQVEIVQHAVVKALPPELQAREKERLAVADDASAAGADHDWLSGARPGIEWLFPTPEHNPRAPVVRIVIKHAPAQSVTLLQPDGTVVSALNFEGTQHGSDRRSAVSVWRGVALKDGDNLFRAEVRNADGTLAETLTRSVHYANAPARALLRTDKSILLADGLNRPVVAVQLLDRDGRPVRAGVTGPVSISAPYRSWQQVEMEQTRQLAGRDRFTPLYKVEGDEGIAYIELAPTTESGTVQLGLSFQLDGDGSRRQELRAWLEPEPRDWVVVGFAEGTLGYNTLKDNSQALAGEVDDNGYSDGQVSLYAKGRVLGKWLLTMAYDSDKKKERQSLLGVIDPDQYYTLYGDGAEQRYDAPSQDKLYLKLERGQFYALFGDFNTGLNQTQLSRYNRTLNGVKSENSGGPVVFTVFAAETAQNFARDEIQGDGTSGLYRLRNAGIVLNSETLRIETRDRLRSEKILDSRTLTRHIDYDIDYGNGTLFFRQPLPSRDSAFNPVFIVAEYETLRGADRETNAGGRIGVNLREGRVQAGMTAIHDESKLASSDLAGADLKLRVGQDSELRLEAARSKGEAGALSPEGAAWLAEFEHHSGPFDALLYFRRQDPGFGLNQQNLSEAGQQKLGAEGQWRFAKHWALEGQLYQQENLGNATLRDAAASKLRYEAEQGGFSLGAQAIEDSVESGALDNQDFRSQQATASANRFFFNRKLELSAQAESALGGNRDSSDYPNRYLLGAGYALSDSVRLLAGQELTDGAAFDTSTTRAGLQVSPWKGARLDSTLNQTQMSEYGPRTFGQFGLTQALLLNERWGLDISVDSSQTLRESDKPAPVLNPSYPVAPGGSLTGPGLTEDFIAISTGATYRTPLWSWNGRFEDRNGESSDRYGLVSNFLRQAQAGVAFASSAELFRSRQDAGGEGWLASVDLSWAWRPLGAQWSLLDRLELRYEQSENGSTATGLFGNNSLTGTASTRRLINNFALNRVSREWSEADRQGNLFRRHERNQWSLYYGAKYVMDSFDGEDYSGFTDLVGLEVRHDVKHWLDVGLQASTLNSWSQGTHAYSFGPMVGVSPVTNGWVTLGWNMRGFSDSDFDAARYTAQGPYLQLRFKFDQNTRLRDFEKASATREENTLK